MGNVDGTFWVLMAVWSMFGGNDPVLVGQSLESIKVEGRAGNDDRNDKKMRFGS